LVIVVIEEGLVIVATEEESASGEAASGLETISASAMAAGTVAAALCISCHLLLALLV
jgi:hypothetical protein